MWGAWGDAGVLIGLASFLGVKIYLPIHQPPTAPPPLLFPSYLVLVHGVLRLALRVGLHLRLVLGARLLVRLVIVWGGVKGFDGNKNEKKNGA